MIFNPISTLKSSSEKSIFKEKINMYIRIVETICEKNGIKYEKKINPLYIEELINMGILDTEGDIGLLTEILNRQTIERFKKAISTYIIHSDEMYNELFRFSNKERRKLQLSQKNNSKIKMVDLFCGAGGLSLGFSQAGYSIMFSNDLDNLSIETYKFNHPEISSDRIVCGDVRKLASEIDKHVSEDIDIVVGGPPCQGFSSANKHHRVIDDPRNELYKYFIEAVSKLAPKIVVMENVKGMMKVANQVVEDYSSIHVQMGNNHYTYEAGYRLFNSADFSVAQSRERLFYIAIRSDIAEKFHVSPEDIFNKINNINKEKPRYNLADALEYIRPLQAPHIKNVGEIDTEEGGRKVDLNPFTGIENEYLKIINLEKEIPITYNHKARYVNHLNYEIYNRLNQGDDATNSKIADIMPYAHRNDKFKDKYYRLIADRPCRTITAHMRSDCHSHIHPSQPRALTPREAARVQSFPDNYLFFGPYLKTYIQIGNAVPVVMARTIAEVLKVYLE